MAHIYILYEQILSVPFLCPMLLSAPDGTTPNIIVAEGPVPRYLKAPLAEGQNWQADTERFLLRGGCRAGRFLVEGGNRITLERNLQAEEDLLCSLLITTVIAALLRQRGLLVLHANVVNTSSGAIAISGVSGSGKSTTQAALLNNGCSMVSEDITALRFDNNGRVVAIPGIPKLNLCEDAANKFGHDVTKLKRNPLRNIKVLVPVHSIMEIEPAPLKAIYLLNNHSCDHKLTKKPLLGAEKFAALQECIYGPQFPDEHSNMFSLSIAVTEQVEILRIERPNKGWSVSEVVGAILS